MDEDAISSERNTKYRQYDIRTRVVGLIPPYVCAFTVAHSAAPHSERITRMCDGYFHSVEHAHNVALKTAIRVVELILSDTELFCVVTPPPEPNSDPTQST